MRDVWQLSVDGYFLDPLGYFERAHSFRYGQYYLPQVLYVVSLRAQYIDVESFLASAYDPYVFMRDAYHQQGLYAIYDGNLPAAVVQQMQGPEDKNFDPDALLDQHHKWEKKHSDQNIKR